MFSTTTIFCSTIVDGHRRFLVLNREQLELMLSEHNGTVGLPSRPFLLVFVWKMGVWLYCGAGVSFGKESTLAWVVGVKQVAREVKVFSLYSQYDKSVVSMNLPVSRGSRVDDGKRGRRFP